MRPVTVSDMIQMTQPGQLRFQGEMVGKDDIGIFSPDRKLFLVLLQHGNLETNTNDYWIQCFQVSKVMTEDRGRELVHFSSSSNRPAISQIRWLDNGTISFLAEKPNQVAQLYLFSINTGQLRRLTNSPNTLTAYAIAPGLQHIAFAAQRPYTDLTSELTEGAEVIHTQPLLDLLLGHRSFDHEAFTDLYVQDGLSGIPSKVKMEGDMYYFYVPSLSPDGRYLIVKSVLSGKPDPRWHEYDFPALKAELARSEDNDERHFIYQFELVDMDLRTSRPLLNSPIPPGDYPDVLWSPDSKSVLLSQILLPLDDSNDEPSRQNKKFLAELHLSNGKITPITTEQIRLRSWDATTGKVTGLPGTWSGAGGYSEGHPLQYEKTNGLWKKVANDQSVADEAQRIYIALVEDMNTPPRIVVEKPKTGEKRILLDLNPKFKNLEFGEVRDLGTLTNNGLSVKAGIYLPVGYKPGIRYPLVIQTHEWTPERFWIDGPFHSACAAQALAGKGFVVAQIALNRSHRYSLQEVQEEAAGYDAVISYLDKKEMIDTSKIGIIGFSRTVLGVEYALTHSQYHFAAATLADGSDAGYFRYIAYLNSSPGLTMDSEGINGGVPVAGGIQSWLRNSPGFNLNHVSAPIRLEAYGPEMLLFTWETFGMMSHLKEPVDFIYMPNGEHVLVKPLERMASQGGNVDWFSFWLLNEEDRNAAKRAQYQRWEHLRNLNHSDLEPAGVPATY